MYFLNSVFKVITAHLVWALPILFLYRSHAFVFSLLKKMQVWTEMFQMLRISILIDQFLMVRAVKTFQISTDLYHL